MDTFETFLAGAEHALSGWDFSYISRTDRMATEPLPWCYASKVLPYQSAATSMLDVGTGGGELLSLLQPFPPQISATEGYEPNLPVARQRLEPLGVTVVAVSEDNRLPFPDATFDLVIDSHDSYDPGEIRRVLHPHDIFITQQVGGHDAMEFNEWLDIPFDDPSQEWSLDIAATSIEAAGMRIFEQQEASVQTRFYDVGAVIFYLRAIPWQFPGFSVEHHREHLEAIHQRIMAQGYVQVTSQRFLILARKP